MGYEIGNICVVMRITRAQVVSSRGLRHLGWLTLLLLEHPAWPLAQGARSPTVGTALQGCDGTCDGMACEGGWTPKVRLGTPKSPKFQDSRCHCACQRVDGIDSSSIGVGDPPALSVKVKLLLSTLDKSTGSLKVTTS